jgi:hypothetical protein
MGRRRESSSGEPITFWNTFTRKQLPTAFGCGMPAPAFYPLGTISGTGD